MKALIKLVATAAAAAVGYEAWAWWRKKNSFTPIVAGHGYTVVLSYSGSGIPAGEAPPSATDVQAALNAGAAGVGTTAVSTVSLDPAKKTLTYLFGALSSFNGTAAALAPKTFPSTFGSMSVALVQDTGSIPVTPAAATATPATT